MKNTFFYLAFCFLFSCSSKEENVANFDDLAPVSTNNGTKNVVSDSLTNEKPTTHFALNLLDSLDKKAQWMKLDSLLYLDRFGAKNTDKFIIKTLKDSISLLQFSFSDSTRTKNAFYNWLDCFGTSCASVRVGGKLKIPKRNTWIFVLSKQIVVLESNLHLKEQFVRTLIEKKKEKEEYLYLIDAPISGKTIWKRIKKGEESIVKESNENS